MLSCNTKEGNIHEFLEENIREIKSINSEVFDDKDLVSLEKSIGRARFVFLGEQHHGDAPTFQAKTRIVKFLHEKMGFNIIAFESDFYGLYQINQKQKTTGKQDIKDNLYSMWGECDEFDSFLEYIATPNLKLKVYGVDSRMKLSYSQRFFYKEWQELDLAIVDTSRFNQILANLLENEYQDRSTKEEQEFFYKTLERCKNKFAMLSFKRQAIVNLMGFAKNSWEGNYITDFRDIQMANNLLWLSKKFNKEKIIVWAHNFHISKNFQLAKNKAPELFLHATTTMGTEFVKKVKEEECYFLGFASGNGFWGNLSSKEKFKVGEVRRNSVEHHFLRKKIEYGFVDFKKKNDKYYKRQSFEMKGYYHLPSFELPWEKVYDGVFFVKEMYPCSALKQK